MLSSLAYFSAYLLAAWFVALRVRHLPMSRILLGIAAGFCLLVPSVVAAAWAGIDLARLDVLLAVAILMLAIAAVAIALDRIGRRRPSSTKSPFDLS